jgi:hypothetical protein
LDRLVSNREKQTELVDPHNFGALEAKTGHETFLVEGKGVDAAMERVASEAAGHSFIHNRLSFRVSITLEARKAA